MNENLFGKLFLIIVWFDRLIVFLNVDFFYYRSFGFYIWYNVFSELYWICWLWWELIWWGSYYGMIKSKVDIFKFWFYILMYEIILLKGF